MTEEEVRITRVYHKRNMNINSITCPVAMVPETAQNFKPTTNTPKTRPKFGLLDEL